MSHCKFRLIEVFSDDDPFCEGEPIAVTIVTHVPELDMALCDMANGIGEYEGAAEPAEGDCNV